MSVSERRPPDIDALYTGGLGLEELEERSLPLRRGVFENWSYIADLVTKHEGAIQNRWIKKSKNQRRDILLSAQPEMIQFHRPDVVAIRRGPLQNGAVGEQLQTYFWPHINVEDLSRPEPILWMLNSRGLHSPYVFVYTDLRSAKLINHGMAPITLDEYAMAFYDTQSYQAYGVVSTATRVPREDEWPFKGLSMTAVRGMLLLNLQDGLYDFLARFVYAVLHDVSSGTIPHFPTPILPSAAVGPLGETSLAARVFEASYRPSGEPNIDRFRALVAARAFDAKLRVAALQEDPTCWLDAVKEWRDHQVDMMLDTDGNRHPRARSLGEQAHWNEHAFTTALYALVDVELWADMCDRLDDLPWTEGTLYLVGSPREQEFHLALSSLLRYVHCLFHFPAMALEKSFKSSPPLRPFFRRLVPSGHLHCPSTLAEWNHDTLEPCLRHAVHSTERGTPFYHLLWVITQLIEYEKFDILGPHTLMEELDHLLKSEPQTQRLVSPCIARQISDISILSECYRQLCNFAPIANMDVRLLLEAESNGRASFDSLDKRIRRIMRCLNTSRVWKTLDLTPARIECPKEGPRGKQDVNRIRAAEATLDRFWDVLLDLLRKTAGPELSSYNTTLPDAPVRRTLEWKEPTRTPDSDDITTEPLAEVTAPAEKATTA